jgi:hypothetical protein
VIQRLPRSQIIRSGAPSPPSRVSRVDLFVARSMRVTVVSRWLTTHAVPPANAMLAGPSPAGMCAMTRFRCGDTRTTSAPWSAATQTEPPPVQML